MNKKAWLDYLYYHVGKQQFDFFVCGLKLLPDGNVFATKWKKYSEVCFPLNPWESNKIEWLNQRQIFPNEIVLDIEEKENIKPIVEKLEESELDYTIWETGSRGYHISILFPEKLTQKKKEAAVKILGTDLQKCSEKCLIALENCPHWKTGKLKKEISKEVILNDK